jgi:hypothetical protein
VSGGLQLLLRQPVRGAIQPLNARAPFLWPERLQCLGRGLALEYAGWDNRGYALAIHNTTSQIPPAPQQQI